jgi:hypothetical protein
MFNIVFFLQFCVFILFEYPAACCGWDGATGDMIRAYIEKHGTSEEKEGYKQMQLLDF